MNLTNKQLLDDFTRFCGENPELRFWQALRAWAEVGFIYVSNSRIEPLEDVDVQDTFYWVNKNK